MRLTRLRGECPDGRTCATLYETERGTGVVQGYRLDVEDLAQLDLPGGATAVRIPSWLLRDDRTYRGTTVVQGYQLAEDDLAQLRPPEGETAVEVPLSVLRDNDDERS